MNKIIQILFCILLCICCVGLYIKYDNLKHETNIEKVDYLKQIDSLILENGKHLKKIELYESELSKLKLETDSLYKVKSQIIIKRDTVIVSNDISSAVKQLKINLSKWKD